MAKYYSSARISLPPRISPFDLQFAALPSAEIVFDDRWQSHGLLLTHSSRAKHRLYSTTMNTGEKPPRTTETLPQSRVQQIEAVHRGSNIFAFQLHQDKPSYTPDRRPEGREFATSKFTRQAQEGHENHTSVKSQRAMTDTASIGKRIDPIRDVTSLLSPPTSVHPGFTSTKPSTMRPTSMSADEENLYVDRHADPRDVYTAESSSYWTGRYIGLSDNLQNSKPRSSQLNALQSSQRVNQIPDSDDEFDGAKTWRKEEVLRRLRGHCKTLEALKGFNAFEYRLKLADHRLSPAKSDTHPNIRQTSNLPLHKRNLPASLRPSFSTGLKSSQSNSSTSTLTTFAVSGKAPCDGSDLLQRSQLGKSKTFSNFDAPMFWNHNTCAKRSSVRRTTTASRALAVQERELRPSAAGHFTNHISSIDVTRSKSTQCKVQWTSGRSASKQGPGGSGLSPSSNEPTQVMATSISTATLTTITNNAGGPGSMTRRQHRSESMRRLVDIGLREVIKMGRRVGSTSTDTPPGRG